MNGNIEKKSLQKYIGRIGSLYCFLSAAFLSAGISEHKVRPDSEKTEYHHILLSGERLPDQYVPQRFFRLAGNEFIFRVCTGRMLCLSGRFIYTERERVEVGAISDITAQDGSPHYDYEVREAVLIIKASGGSRYVCSGGHLRAAYVASGTPNRS